MGGVTHYHRSAGTWTPVKTQGDEVPLGSGIVYNTESIDIGEIAPGDTRLFIAGNTGTSSGPVEMRLDAGHEPGPPTFLDPAPFLTAVGWDPLGETAYTNDVEFLDYAGSKLVLVDMADVQRHQGALVVNRWEPSGGSWACAAYGLAQLSPTASDLTNIIGTADGENGSEFAFVADDCGIFSVDLTPLSGPPASSIQALRVPSNLVNQDGGTLRSARGIATSGDRLFVFYNNGQSVPPAICVYRWNRTTGEIETPPEVVYHPDSSKSPLFIPHFGRTWRVRFHPDAEGGRGGKLYDSSDGYLFQITYDPSRPADPLRYTGYWKSDCTSYFQDSRIYDFGDGPRLLVVKGLEAFAFVNE